MKLKPMSYNAFCDMPCSCQVEYLTMLRNMYGASMKDIAEMMGISKQGLAYHRNKHLNKRPYFSKGLRLLKEDDWNEFVRLGKENNG